MGSDEDADGRMGIGTRERECERERPPAEGSKLAEARPDPGGESNEELATETFSKGSGSGLGGEGESDPLPEDEVGKLA